MQEQVLAILLAVLPASLGYWAKLRAQSLACRRMILSYLLEIRHTLICSSLTSVKLSKGFDDAVEKIFAKYRQVGSESEIDEALNAVKPLVYRMFHETITNYVPSFEPSFVSEFCSALKEFRKEQPLLAFQLLGWEKEQAYLRIKQDYANQFINLDALSDVEPLKQFLEKTLTEDEDETLVESIRLLDGLIYKMARCSGLITYVRISYYLFKKPVKAFSVNQPDFLKEMAPILAEVDDLVKGLLVKDSDHSKKVET